MLKLQYFGSQVQRANSFKKTGCWERLKAGEEGSDKRMRWLDGIIDLMEPWLLTISEPFLHVTV